MDKVKKKIIRFDQKLINFMGQAGHGLEKYLLAILFIWFGGLKVFGEFSASSIIAKSVYWFDPQVMVPLLGFWEIVIGISLVVNGLTRLAILLLLIRIPGTFLALLRDCKSRTAGRNTGKPEINITAVQ